MAKIKGTRHAIVREVGIGGVETNGSVVFAGVEVNSQRIAGTKCIVLLESKRQTQPIAAGNPAPKLILPVGFSLRSPTNPPDPANPPHPGFPKIRPEKIQAGPRDCGTGDLFTVVPCGLELPKLTANDFVTRAVIARHADTTHIHPARGFSQQGHLNAIGGPVNVGAHFDLANAKAKIAEVFGEGLGGLGDLIGVVYLARLNGDQRLEFVFFAQVIARQFDFTHHKLLALRSR
jgi:hypothetical protein